MITPAISVLGAVEGLNVVTPAFQSMIVPISVVILLLLVHRPAIRYRARRTRVRPDHVRVVRHDRRARRRGDRAASRASSPRSIRGTGVRFFAANGRIGFLTLGAVVLAVTGAEALYADMGHFGKRPIRLAWFALVLPALLLNYFGQGALLLRNPAAVANPFYLLAPRAMLAAARRARDDRRGDRVAGADLRRVLADAAGGAARLLAARDHRAHVGAARPARSTSPRSTRMLMIGCLVLVVAFKTSTRLGAAYGIAVTGTMAITSLLFYVVRAVALELVARARRCRSRSRSSSIDLSLFCGERDQDRVRRLGADRHRHRRVHADEHVEDGSPPAQPSAATPARCRSISSSATSRGASRCACPGTAVFMTSSNDGVPVVLLHHLKHNKVLHEQVILMSVVTHEVPEVKRSERVSVEKLEHGFYRVTARYGFMESPNVPEILQWARESGIKAKPQRHDVLSRPRAHHHRRRRGARRGDAPRSGRRRASARWRAGARSSSSSCRATRARRRSSSVFRRTASSSSERRSSSRRAWRSR